MSHQGNLYLYIWYCENERFEHTYSSDQSFANTHWISDPLQNKVQKSFIKTITLSFCHQAEATL